MARAVYFDRDGLEDRQSPSLQVGNSTCCLAKTPRARERNRTADLRITRKPKIVPLRPTQSQPVAYWLFRRQVWRDRRYRLGQNAAPRHGIVGRLVGFPADPSPVDFRQRLSTSFSSKVGSPRI